MARPIIVTGAAGFIGRNTVAELNARGEDEIILVDELGVNKPGEAEKWKDLVGLRFEDIVSPEEFLGLIEDGAFANARSVIHLGACSATTEKDAGFLLRNNYQYTRVLCNWALSDLCMPQARRPTAMERRATMMPTRSRRRSSR
jgi:ADP-L-glycero-D-manno-heptose 6-epimerase